MLMNMHKKVRVGVVFENEPRPVWFSLHGEKVPVKDICYRWKERDGSFLIHKYTVTDGTNIFEIAFNTEDSCWYLESIDDGGGV
jgi:hypothetical protein